MSGWVRCFSKAFQAVRVAPLIIDMADFALETKRFWRTAILRARSLASAKGSLWIEEVKAVRSA